MIVVDTNVVAYLLLPGPFGAQALSLRQREPDWIVPAIWRSEFRNVLAGYMRCKGLSLGQAIEVQTLAERMPGSAEFMVSSTSVLELVHSSSCSAYDCEFICLAQAKKLCLVTADKQILANFPGTAIPLSS